MQPKSKKIKSHAISVILQAEVQRNAMKRMSNQQMLCSFKGLVFLHQSFGCEQNQINCSNL